MNHQGRSRYYSDERGREERGNGGRFREDRPAWDFEDEDEEFQGGRWGRASRSRDREHERRFSQSNGPSGRQRDYDEEFGEYGQGAYGQGNYGQGSYGQGASGQRRGYGQGGVGYGQEEYRGGRAQRYRSDWDDDQSQGRGARSPGRGSYGAEYQSGYDDFEERYRQPSAGSYGQGVDWGESPQRGGRSSQSRLGASSSGYRSGSRNYGESSYGAGSQAYGSPASSNYWYAEYWLIPGPYSGTGPKGYQRSSESLKEQVCERLEGHGEIDASEIEVAIQNGEVTLSGKVESREQKRMAEDCACSVRGVKDVHNQIKVEARKQQSRLEGNQMDEPGSKSADKKGKQASNPAF